RKERPDLILVDLETPQAGGLRLLRRLKSLPETRGIPAVAVSSEGPGGEKEHCQGLGVEGFVSKPIDPAAFRLEISRVLSGRREKKTPPPSLSARGG
ncbi:MAG: response regulator, partial [Candidatus Tectomicrobia bacterium]|nr:response regulator [Candidatus Tectomicrobia bacterium]